MPATQQRDRTAERDPAQAAGSCTCPGCWLSKPVTCSWARTLSLASRAVMASCCSSICLTAALAHSWVKEPAILACLASSRRAACSGTHTATRLPDLELQLSNKGEVEGWVRGQFRKCHAHARRDLPAHRLRRTEQGCEHDSSTPADAADPEVLYDRRRLVYRLQRVQCEQLACSRALAWSAAAQVSELQRAHVLWGGSAWPARQQCTAAQGAKCCQETTSSAGA